MGRWLCPHRRVVVDMILGRKRGFCIALCDRRKWQGAIARCRKVRCERVAGCEVVELHLATFGCRRVRLSGVAPYDLFLSILCDSSTDAKVDANITRARPLIINPRCLVADF